MGTECHWQTETVKAFVVDSRIPDWCKRRWPGTPWCNYSWSEGVRVACSKTWRRLGLVCRFGHVHGTTRQNAIFLEEVIITYHWELKLTNRIMITFLFFCGRVSCGLHFTIRNYVFWAIHITYLHRETNSTYIVSEVSQKVWKCESVMFGGRIRNLQWITVVSGKTGIKPYFLVGAESAETPAALKPCSVVSVRDHCPAVYKGTLCPAKAQNRRRWSMDNSSACRG